MFCMAFFLCTVNITFDFLQEQTKCCLSDTDKRRVGIIQLTVHTMAVQSLEDDARYLPLCENCTNHTSFLCSNSTYKKKIRGDYIDRITFSLFFNGA